MQCDSCLVTLNIFTFLEGQEVDMYTEKYQQELNYMLFLLSVF